MENKELTPMETRLFETLKRGPMEKWDLIPVLYGEAVNVFKAEVRFWKLMSRLRKRHGAVVLHREGRYLLERRRRPRTELRFRE